MLVSAFLLSVERQIPRWPTQLDRETDSVLTRYARLQTGARQCETRDPGFFALYNEYVRRHGGEIQMAVERLAHLYTRQTVRPSAVQMHIAKTLDRASLEARLNSVAFCSSSFADLQTIMMRVPVGGLTQFVSFIPSGQRTGETRLAARNP